MSTQVLTAVDPDEEAKKLMNEWGYNDLDKENLDDVESVPDEIHDYDDFLEQFRRDVVVTDDAIDHLILGTGDLDKALEAFESMTGAKPVMVVSLNGVGTKSARIAFEECAFLEIIGPDPKQDIETTLKKSLEALPADGTMTPFHYAVRSKSTIASKAWESHDLKADMVSMVAQDRGQLWKWDMNLFNSTGLVPYFVDWGEMHHAAGRLPIVGKLGSVQVSASSGSPVHALTDEILGVTTSTGEDSLTFTFTSDKGTHTFTSSTPAGIEFPN